MFETETSEGRGGDGETPHEALLVQRQDVLPALRNAQGLSTGARVEASATEAVEVEIAIVPVAARGLRCVVPKVLGVCQAALACVI